MKRSIQSRSRKSTTTTIPSRKRVLDFLVAMAILVGLSSLPFLHELIIDENGSFSNWVPDLNIQGLLRDEEGRILGYTTYRVFLYYFSTEIAILIAFIGWYTVAKGKNRYYTNALLLCTISVAYHLFLILTNTRKTQLNDFDLKLAATMVLAAVLFGFYCHAHQKRRRMLRPAYAVFGSCPTKTISAKVVLGWSGLIGASTFLYLHDILTLPGVGLRQWVPEVGMVEFLTTPEGTVLGFNTYRTFLLTFFIQLMAQIAWLGWLRDADFKLYKPFLVVPLGFSMHQLVITLLDKGDIYLNKPDFKLLFILGLGVVVGVFYYFKNEALPVSGGTFQKKYPSNNGPINQQLE